MTSPTLALDGSKVFDPDDDCGMCGVESCRHGGAPHPWTSVAQVRAVVEASNQDLLEALEGLVERGFSLTDSYYDNDGNDMKGNRTLWREAKEAVARTRGEEGARG